MKRFLRKAAACLLAALMILSSAACGSTKNDKLVRYNIPADPVNLDPPLAADAASALVVTNLFEGLFRLGPDGTPEPAAAEEYDVSDDGLTYVFRLRKDGRWSDGTPVTAEDFLFGFQRLFTAGTGSPLAAGLYCIKNAEAVCRGKLPLSELGVTAESGGVLTIRLEKSNESFPALLASPAAMPCSERFFTEAKGRYGLSDQTILSNGPYVLKEWVRGKHLALRRNPEYHGAASMKNGGVSLYVQTDAEATKNDFENDVIHAFSLEGDQVSSLAGKGYDIERSSSSVWGLVFNRKGETLGNDNVANALLYGLDRSSFAERLPSYLTPARAIVPPAVTLSGEAYRDGPAGEAEAPAYEPERAAANARDGFAELGVSKLTALRFIAPAETPHAELFSCLSQVWQRDLQIYFVVEELEEEEYRRRLDEGDFDCAVVRLAASENSPAAFLAPFSERKPYGDPPAGLSGLLRKAGQSGSEESAAFYARAEQLVLDSGAFLPLYYQTDCFVTSRAVTGFVHDFTCRIVDFKDCAFR